MAIFLIFNRLFRGQGLGKLVSVKGFRQYNALLHVRQLDQRGWRGRGSAVANK